MSTKIDRETLRGAADILQAAHDFIEVVGFDISTYGHTPRPGEKPAPMCYIGSMRHVAELDPSPAIGNGVESDGANGGSPELAQALTILDTYAKSEMERMMRENPSEFSQLVADVTDPRDEWGEDAILTGRFIEELGFMIAAKFELVDPEPEYRPLDNGQWLKEHEAWYDRKCAYQQAEALGILRNALTQIHQVGV